MLVLNGKQKNIGDEKGRSGQKSDLYADKQHIYRGLYCTRLANDEHILQL